MQVDGDSPHTQWDKYQASMCSALQMLGHRPHQACSEMVVHDQINCDAAPMSLNSPVLDALGVAGSIPSPKYVPPRYWVLSGVQGSSGTYLL